MNERTRFFIKIYLSHFILERVDVGCVWGELETGTDCYILTQSSSDHSSTSFSSWLGLLNRGSLRAQSPLSAAGSHAGILSLTDSNSNWNWPKPSVTPGYIIVFVHQLPLFLRLFTQVHLLIDGSVEGQYITVPKTQNGFKYSYQTLIILLNIIPSFVHMVSWNVIQYKLFNSTLIIQ